MKDKYVYGAGGNNSWAKTFVVQENLLKPFGQDISSDRLPEKQEYRLVPEKSPSRIATAAKTAGVLGGVAALFFLVTQNDK